MLKKLAIYAFVLFCIFVEIAFTFNYLSLRKKVTAVFSPHVEALETSSDIEQKELAITQNDIENTEDVLPTTSETVEKEETKELGNDVVKTETIKGTEKKEEKQVAKVEEKIVNTGTQENKNTSKVEVKSTENKTQEAQKKSNVEQKASVNQTQEVKNNTKTSNQTTTKYPDNCLIIGNNVINIKIAPASQRNVNAYDVVQDNADVSTSDNIVLFGHNYNSFKCLRSVKVGQKIKLNNYGKTTEYTVFRSERGLNSSDGTEIYSENDGKELVYTYHGYDDVLKLVTCDGNQRWVVSAYKCI